VVAKLGLGVPAGSQQQQPSQSVHVVFCVSIMHSVLHEEAASGVDVAASIVLMVPLLLLPELLLLLLLEELAAPLLLPELLLLEELVVPLLLPELLLLDEAPESVSVAPLEPDPLSSLEEPVGGLELLLQAASPTVDDVPMTTMTWKSFSMFMGHTLPPIGALGTRRARIQVGLERVVRGTPPHQADSVSIGAGKRARVTGGSRQDGVCPRATCHSW
jgi:hypothetical protein